MNRKRRSLTPYSKLRRAYTVNIASRADSGQWRFTSAKFCCAPNTCETKRELREARGGYRIIRPRGIRGWPAYEDRDRTRAIKRWGILFYFIFILFFVIGKTNDRSETTRMMKWCIGVKGSNWCRISNTGNVIRLWIATVVFSFILRLKSSPDVHQAVFASACPSQHLKS
jgi:hypothetical protein